MSPENRLEHVQQALWASCDVMMAQTCSSNLERVLLVSDGCWLPSLVQKAGQGERCTSGLLSHSWGFSTPSFVLSFPGQKHKQKCITPLDQFSEPRVGEIHQALFGGHMDVPTSQTQGRSKLETGQNILGSNNAFCRGAIVSLNSKSLLQDGRTHPQSPCKWLQGEPLKCTF